MNLKALLLGFAVGLLFIFLPPMLGNGFYPRFSFLEIGFPWDIIPFALLLCPFSLLLFLMGDFRKAFHDAKSKAALFLRAFLFFLAGSAAAYVVFTLVILVALSQWHGPSL